MNKCPELSAFTLDLAQRFQVYTSVLQVPLSPGHSTEVRGLSRKPVMDLMDVEIIADRHSTDAISSCHTILYIGYTGQYVLVFKNYQKVYVQTAA